MAYSMTFPGLVGYVRETGYMCDRFDPYSKKWLQTPFDCNAKGDVRLEGREQYHLALYMEYMSQKNLDFLTSIPYQCFTELSLEMTEIVSLAPIGSLKNLTTLELSRSHGSNLRDAITDMDWSWLEQLPSLQHMALEDFPLSHVDLRFLTRTPRLSTLSFHRSALNNDHLYHLTELTNLAELDLRETRVSPKGLHALQRFPSLDTLRISGKKYTDELADSLLSLKQLSYLNFENTNLTDKMLSKILESCPLSTTKIDSSPIQWHISSQQSNLRRLSISNCPLDSASLAYLGEIESLQSLHLRGVKVSAVDMKNLDALQKLEHLSLEYIEMRDVLSTEMPRVAQLHSCTIYDTPIDAKFCKLLGMSPHLERLEFQEESFDDACLLTLQNLSQIQVLSLQSTGVSSSGFLELQHCSQLQKLYLFNAHLTRENLLVFSRLPNLRYMRIAECTLDSPEGLYELQQLSGLYVDSYSFPYEYGYHIEKEMELRTHLPNCEIVYYWY